MTSGEGSLGALQPSQPAVSKKAKKRLIKQQQWEAQRDARKEARKKKEQEKKAKKQTQKNEEEAARKLTQELEETAEATVSVGSGVSDIKEPLIKKPKLRILSSMKVVVDLDFDKYMNEKEISQLSSQLTRCYSFNNKSSNPVGLHFTSFGGRLQERFENRLQEYHNWKDVVFHNNSYLDNFFKEDLVYLTADEEAVLEELDETKVYIIGGVVDRNRHKHLCYHKAKLEGIATAKLPISQYINLTTRHVLTVNHVFEILLNWLETKDWRETLMNVIPPRKFNPEGKKKRRETTKKGKADAVRVDTDESSTSEI